MTKIGILGGTFNPVHTEHIEMARRALLEMQLDKLLVMPTYLPPHKEVIPAPSEDRLNMLRLAFENDEKIEVSDYEIAKQGKSYTYLTVEHFKQEQDCQLYFFVGGDMLTDFKTWRYPERILAACNLCVFDRDDFYADYKAEQEYFIKNFGKDFIRLKYRGKNFSSTKIRIYTSLGLSIQGMTADSVAQYIKQTGLYSGDELFEFVRNVLPEKRRIHTASVIEAALRKAKQLKLETKKVLTAALLHDVAKYIDPTSVKGFTCPKDVPKPVVHAFLGAYVAEHILGIKDAEIIDAIRYHTSGKADMSVLGKLIFVADMVEENRNYEGVEILRELYEKADFEHCFIECLKEEFLHLQNKKQKIYIETVNAYNYYVKDQK